MCNDIILLFQFALPGWHDIQHLFLYRFAIYIFSLVRWFVLLWSLTHFLVVLFVFFLNIWCWLPFEFRQQRVCLECRRPGFDLWIRKIPWRREWQSTPVFLPREFHGQAMGLQRVRQQLTHIYVMYILGSQCNGLIWYISMVK